MRSINFFSPYAVKAIHLVIDYAAPSNDLILLISGLSGWYGNIYADTYAKGFLTDMVNVQGWKKGGWSGWMTAHFLFSPLVVPQLTPYICAGMSVAAFIATSISLNLIAQLCFGSNKKKEILKNPLEPMLAKMGIDIPQKPTSIAKEETVLPQTIEKPVEEKVLEKVVEEKSLEKSVPAEPTVASADDDIFGDAQKEKEGAESCPLHICHCFG